MERKSNDRILNWLYMLRKQKKSENIFHSKVQDHYDKGQGHGEVW